MSNNQDMAYLLRNPTPVDIGNIASQSGGGYGTRPDGSLKGSGWLGAIPTTDGRTMTELTAQSNVDGNEMMYPLITPNQGFKNLSELANGMQPSQDTRRNAIEHAMKMIMSGRSPYISEPFLNPAQSTLSIEK